MSLWCKNSQVLDKIKWIRCQFETFFLLLLTNRKICLNRHRTHRVFPKYGFNIEFIFFANESCNVCARNHTVSNVWNTSNACRFDDNFFSPLFRLTMTPFVVLSFISRRPTRFCRGSNFRCRTWTTQIRIEWRVEKTVVSFKMEQLL